MPQLRASNLRLDCAFFYRMIEALPPSKWNDLRLSLKSGMGMNSTTPRRSLILKTTDDLLMRFHTQKGVPSEKGCLAYLNAVARQACGDNCPICGVAFAPKIRHRKARACAQPACGGLEGAIPPASLLGRRRGPSFYNWVMGAWTFSQEKHPMSPQVLRAYGISNKTARRMIPIFQEAMAIERTLAPISQEVVITVELEGGRRVFVDLLSLKERKGRYAGARLSMESQESEKEDLKDFGPVREWGAFSGGWSGHPKGKKDLRLRLAEFNFNQRWKRNGRRPETTMVRLLALLLTPAPGRKI